MIENINVRFFVRALIPVEDEFEEFASPDEQTIVEVTERCFTEQQGEIEYEKNTVFANGCRQVCLTKHDLFNDVYVSELELIE